MLIIVSSQQVYSDRELAQQIDRIVEIISSSKAEWDIRAEAIRKFHGLLVGGANEFESFLTQARRMIDPLSKQVSIASCVCSFSHHRHLPSAYRSPFECCQGSLQRCRQTCTAAI